MPFLFNNNDNWEQAKSYNEDDINNDNYSILGKLENYRINGKFIFKLVYPEVKGANIWTQI